jgi:hypothetical protein
VGGGIVGLGAERLRERLTGTRDGVAIECFEGGTSFDKRPIWGEERIQRCIGLPRSAPRNLRAETITAACQRLDVRSAVWLRAQRLAKARYRLLDAVVSYRHVLPGSLDELIFRQRPSGIGGQLQQDFNMPIWKENRVAPAKQSPARGIELEGTETIDVGDCAHAVRKLSPLTGEGDDGR